MHPSAADDVGTIAARAQSQKSVYSTPYALSRADDHRSASDAEGEMGEMGLMEMLCPFQLLYGDGVERLGAESARERVRWVSALW